MYAWPVLSLAVISISVSNRSRRPFSSCSFSRVHAHHSHPSFPAISKSKSHHIISKATNAMYHRFRNMPPRPTSSFHSEVRSISPQFNPFQRFAAQSNAWLRNASLIIRSPNHRSKSSSSQNITIIIVIIVILPEIITTRTPSPSDVDRIPPPHTPPRPHTRHPPRSGMHNLKPLQYPPPSPRL